MAVLYSAIIIASFTQDWGINYQTSTYSEVPESLRHSGSHPQTLRWIDSTLLIGDGSKNARTGGGAMEGSWRQMEGTVDYLQMTYPSDAIAYSYVKISACELHLGATGGQTFEWRLASIPSHLERRRCDCLASSAPFTNIQTYLLTYLEPPLYCIQ